MPGGAEAAAAPANTSPFTRLIANVSLPQKFHTIKRKPSSQLEKVDTDLESLRNCHWLGETALNASRRHVYHVNRSRCFGNTH